MVLEIKEEEHFGAVSSAVGYRTFTPLDSCAISSVVERTVHIRKAAGSIPASRTKNLTG